MRIKFRRITIKLEYILIFVILLAETCFLSLPGISDGLSVVNTYHKKYLIVFFVLLFMGINVLCRYHLGGLKFKDKWRIVIYEYIVLIIIGIAVRLSGGNGIVYYVKNFNYYLVLLLYFPLVYFLHLNGEKYFYFILKSIAYIATCYAILAIISKILYQTGSGIRLFSFNNDIQLLQFRNGSLRIARISDFVSIGAVCSMILYVNLKNIARNNRYVVMYTICTIAVVYVSQTRIYEIVCLLALVAYILLGIKSFSKRIVLLAVTIIVVMWQSDIIQSFIASFTSLGESGRSMVVRREGYSFFLSNLMKNGLIGLGVGKISFPYGNYVFVLADYGIVGFIGIFGILGMLFLLYLVWKLVQLMIRTIGNSLQYRHFETLILPVFIIVTSISVIFNDSQRITLLPILLALLSYSEATFMVEK